jgi:hypothetical protein
MFESCVRHIGFRVVFLSLLVILLRERKQGLGFKTCSFKSQNALDLSIFSWVFQHPVVPGVGIEKPVWVSGLCPLFPGGLTSSFVIVLCLPLDVHF